MKKYYRGIGIAIFVWSILLRVYGVADASYWMDESFSLALAEAIARHGYPLLDSGIVFWRDPAYHYALAVMVKLCGPGEMATRMLSVLLGVGTGIVLAALAPKIFSVQKEKQKWLLMLFTLFLTASMSWEIVWSQQARMYMMLQFFFWLTILLFFWWKDDKRNWKRSALMTTSILLTIGSHQFGFFVLFALALWSLFEYQKKIPVLRHIASAIIGVIISILVTIAAVFAIRTLHPDHAVTVNYLSHYLYFFSRTYWITLLLAGYGVLIALYKKQTVTVVWFITLVLAALGIFSFAVTLIQYRYLFFLWPAVILPAAYAVASVTQWKWYCILPLLPLLFLTPEYHFIPPANIALESDPAGSPFPYKSITPQPNFRAAYDYIALQKPDIIITAYPTLTRLYLQRDDTASVWMNMTGLPHASQAERERYTGVPYVTREQLKEWKSYTHGYILLDFFARERMDPEMRKYIEKNFSPVQQGASWISTSRIDSIKLFTW